MRNMVGGCLVQQIASSSWLVRDSRVARLPANTQLIPSIPCCKEVLRPRQRQPHLTHLSNRWQQIATHAVAAAPTLSNAAASVDDAAAAEARLYALYDFVNEHGRLPEVQEHHKGVAVGQFSEHCRQQYHAQQLSQQLEHALRTIPGWQWQLQTKVLQSSFEQSIQVLREFHRRYGRLPKARTSSRLASSGNTPELEATMVLRQVCQT